MIFRRILIANRGEIALRTMRTCRAMGIESVAVYSEFDRLALHVRMAEQAVPIGGPAPADSYLNIQAILAAAKRTHADAIHPGYGFLAENPELAAACENAGIVFIGPRSSVIRAMGSKVEARKLAQEAGLQVVPSVHGMPHGAPGQAGQATEGDFAKVGFPLLIKASAGGGGRGMRIVRNMNEFQEAVTSARSEAERAFGDGTLLIEKYVERARHIEIQIFGDHHGNLMHLNERDCSVQRRYQKIIEESPSPAVMPELREKMGEAALALARKLGYTSAGTVEFLLSPSGEFYFIEVNTRIQVEHPVTEMVTGLDLVRMQIEIAQGQSLPAQRLRLSGHAIEARLYAEDPTNGFLPSTGTLHVWEQPQGMEGVRVDSGVEAGTEIGVYYDPLLAKIIAHGADRETAIRKLVYALKHCAAQGIEANREFLIDVLEHEEFRSGRAHTGFQLQPQRHSEHDEVFAAVARAYIENAERAERTILPSAPIHYRNNPYPSPPMRVEIHGREHRIPAPQPGAAALHSQTLKVTDNFVEAIIDEVRHQFHIKSAAEGGCGPNSSSTQILYIRSSLGQRTVVRLPRYPRRAGAGERQTANSPMPGQVLRILVSEGQQVKLGDALIALEAMKMEQTIKAAMDGVVGAILVKPGQTVAPGQKLVEIQSENSNEHADGSATASS
ncbi:MAG TPA: biotin carboxylase N-terminal domain-containing protein [Candidatus Angelobacter sp.]